MGKGGKGKGAPPPPKKEAGAAPKAAAKAAPTPEELAERRRRDEERMKAKHDKAEQNAETNDGLDADALAQEKLCREAAFKKCPLCGWACPEDGFNQHWVGHENCILEDWLYLGSKDNVNAKTMLRRGITHILNVADHLHLRDNDTTCFQLQCFKDDLEEKRLELEKDADWHPFTKRSFEWEDKEHWVEANLTLDAEGDRSLKSATKWIHEARASGAKVLVHCSMGISRSASVIMAYLMEYEGMTLRHAWDHVEERREIIRPNAGFLRLLGKFEVELKGGEPSLTAEEVDRREKERGKLFSIGGTFDAYQAHPAAASATA